MAGNLPILHLPLAHLCFFFTACEMGIKVSDGFNVQLITVLFCFFNNKRTVNVNELKFSSLVLIIVEMQCDCSLCFCNWCEDFWNFVISIVKSLLSSSPK